MNDVNEKIKELRNEVNRLEREIRELERQNSNYYIGVCVIGDGDYWDEYYHRLGFITEEEANTWVDKQATEDDVYGARYFEVTKEIYDKYWDWVCLDKLQKAINRYDPAINKLENIDSFENSVNEAIEDLTKEIGIRHRSFMHPAD